MYRYLLFDFDGTVFETGEGVTKSVQYAMRKRGVETNLSDLTCFVGPPLQDSFMEFFGLSREEATQAIRDYRERYVPIGLYECAVYEGMPELLRELKAAGRKLAIATSKPIVMAKELLEREGLLELFDVCIGTELNGFDRTKTEVVALAMEQLKAVPEETVMIGDTKYDIIGAIGNGIDSIGVEYGYGSRELAAAGASVILPTVSALRSFLLEE